MPQRQTLSAELTIDASLGSRFKKSFAELDNRVEKSTRKMRNIGGGFRSFSDVDRMFDKMASRINKFTGNDWGSAVTKMTNRFSSGFRKVSTAVTNDLKRKFTDASRSASDKWKKDFTGIGTNLSQRGPPLQPQKRLHPLPVPIPSGQLVKSGFSDIGSGFAAAGLLALGAGYKVKEAFKNTNEQIADTHDNLQALKRQSKNYEDLAKHAREMDKAVSPWLRKIDRVNQRIDEQEQKLDKLRIARERFNKSQRAWGNFKEQVAPTARRAGYAGIGMGIAGGYAAMRGAQQYANFDQALRVLQAEGVSEKEIPVIREQIFKLAETTQFTDTDIANILVGMKKDGQAVDATLTGVSDILKLAVAESKDLNTAWEATRTIINSTQTDLAGALRLQEQLSNATSLSSLQLEDLQYIAGQSLAIYQGINAFQSADFLAFAGQLGPLLRKERIATGLREFALTMSSAAAGNLAKPRQEAFDLLGINIADEQGRLRDAVSILKEFERAFEAPQFLDDEGKQIGDKIQTTLAEIFGREAAPAVVGLIGKSQQIAENIERINTAGTIDKKFSTMDKSLTSAANKFQSAVSVASKRFFLAIDGDGNFANIINGMTNAVQKFSNWIEEHTPKIEKQFTILIGHTKKFLLQVKFLVHKYVMPRLPAIKQFFINFWRDIAKSWTIVRPFVMGVIGVLGKLLDMLGRFAGGNTGMLSWIFLSIVGWKALKIPILAVTAAFNGVMGVVMQLKNHFGTLLDMISSAIGKARTFAETMTNTGAPHIPTGTPTSPSIPLPGPTATAPPVTTPPVFAPALPIPTPHRSIPKPDIDDIIDVEFEVLPSPKSKPLTAPKTKALPAPKTTALDTTKKAGKLEKVKSLFPKMPKAGIFAKIGSWLLKLGNIAKWIMIPISYLIAKLSFLAPVVTAVGSAIAAIGSAIAAIGVGPVVAVVAAVVALWTAAIALIIKNWERVRGAAVAVWKTISTFGSAVWETFKFVVYGIFDLFSWLGSAIWKVISPVATTTAQVFSGIGTGISKVFMGAFGAIKTFAVAVWNFVSNLFSMLFGWIETIASKFTGWFEKWKSFFKKRNEERETEIKLKETIEKAPMDQILDRNIEIYENRNVSYIPNLKRGSIPDMNSPLKHDMMAAEIPVEFAGIDKIAAEKEFAPLGPREIDTIYKERIEKAPARDLLKVNEQLIENPFSLEKFYSEIPEPIEMTAQTPDFSQIAKDTMLNVEADFAKNQPLHSLLPEQNVSQIQNYDTTSVEYIDFSSVDEIDKTLKSGFTSLENINSQIITELRKIQGVGIQTPGVDISVPETPEIKTPESNIDIQTPGVDIQIPQTPEIRTPDINVNTPPVPRPLQPHKGFHPVFPILEKEKEKTENIIRETLVKNPPPPEISPQLAAPNISPVAIDGIPQLTAPNIPQLDAPVFDSPVLSAPNIPPVAIDGIPELAAPNIPQLDAPNIDRVEVAISEPPPQRIEVDPIRVEVSENKKAGDTIENNIEINIVQQPGQDGEELARIVLAELQKSHRTGAYD